MAEEELAILADMQMDFEARRNAEVAEMKRLEEQERRLFEERQRRLKEQEEAIQLEDEVAQKIAACIFSQNYLTELVPQVYKKLEADGYFETEDPDIKEVEEDFWPWLMNEVDSEIATLEASCKLLDTMLEDAVVEVSETSVIYPVVPDTYPEETQVPSTTDLDLQDLKISSEDIESKIAVIGSDLSGASTDEDEK
ncbi:Flagellar radial spoke protein 3, partial [Stegodyphus mimosarum]